MPKKELPPWPFNGYANFALSKGDKEALKAVVWDISEFDNQMSKVLDSGYKCTFKKDKEGDGVMAMLASTDISSNNVGWILCGRGSTPHKALKQALYAHYILFDEDWITSLRKDKEEFDD